MPMHGPKQSASSVNVGRQLQGAVELSGLQTRRWKAGRLFGRLKLADKHLASIALMTRLSGGWSGARRSATG